jgi:hypothetical protein
VQPEPWLRALITNYNNNNEPETNMMWATVQQHRNVTFCPSERLERKTSAILLLRMVRSLNQALVCPQLDNLNTKFCKKRSESTVVERTHTLTQHDEQAVNSSSNLFVEYSAVRFLVKITAVSKRDGCN